MHGPWAPEEGHRFDPRSLLLDPYANALIESAEWQKETPEFDVIFNHTAEGGDNGPTISFRGLDNSTYYMLELVGHGYIDYTGCGNILSCNHPVIWSLIVDCLRHWIIHFHIDGFRFDLASILGRDSDLDQNRPYDRKIVAPSLRRRRGFSP